MDGNSWVQDEAGYVHGSFPWYIETKQMDDV